MDRYFKIESVDFQYFTLIQWLAGSVNGWMIFHTVCFFAIVTKDDGITQPNDFTPMSAINRFEVYCLAFVLVRSKVFPNDF